MNRFKTKNSPILVTAIVTFVIVFVASLLVVLTPVSVNAAPIPAGCPGSTETGPATPDQLKVCQMIPPGCPGSTVQGSVSPSTVCPYDEPILDPDDSCRSKTATGKCAAMVDAAVGCEGSTDAQTGCNFMESFIKPTIKFLSAGVGIVVILVIIVAGIIFSSAGGDPQKVATARKMISNALLALVTYLFLFGILNFLIPGGLI